MGSFCGFVEPFSVTASALEDAPGVTYIVSFLVVFQVLSDFQYAHDTRLQARVSLHLAGGNMETNLHNIETHTYTGEWEYGSSFWTNRLWI